MDIIMSDLHISSPLFKLDNEVIELYNDPKVNRIYILGDLFDTWEEDVFKTLRKRASLIDVINNSGKTEIILRGNHDPLTQDLQALFSNVLVTDSHVTEFFGKNAIMVHGHEFDGGEFWGRVLFTFQWPLERLGVNSKAWLRNLIYKNLLWRENADHNSLVLDMEKKLVEKYGSNFELMIAGHTHIAKMVKEDKNYYINPGTMLYNPSYIVVDNNTMLIKRI